MTALAQDTPRKRSGDQIAPVDRYLPVAASAVFWAGSLVGLNQNGYLVVASADPTIRIVGIAGLAVNNSGIDGAVSCPVEVGCFPFVNSTGTDAITEAHVGRVAYAVDDNTVACTSNLGTRPALGRIDRIDVDGSILVETRPEYDGVEEELIVTAADFSSSQYCACNVNNSGKAVLPAAGGVVTGIVQNAPGNGAVAIVRIRGKSQWIASGTLTQGIVLASDVAGKAKAASALVQATGAASYGVGQGLSAGTVGVAMQALITHCGIQPTSYA